MEEIERVFSQSSIRLHADDASEKARKLNEEAENLRRDTEAAEKEAIEEHNRQREKK